MDPAADDPTRVAWRLRDAVLVGVILFAVTIAVLLLQFPFWSFFHPWFLTNEQSNEVLFIFGYVLLAMIGAVVSLRILRSHRLDDLLESIGWKGARYLPFAAAAGLAAGIAVKFVNFYFSGIGAAREGGLAFVLTMLSGVVIGPLVEECYFRGVLFVAVAKRFGTIAALLISSVAFACMHPTKILTSLPAALLFGIARILTRSVKGSLVTHGAFNVAVYLIEIVLGT